jgi:hypothetical protein
VVGKDRAIENAAACLPVLWCCGDVEMDLVFLLMIGKQDGDIPTGL